MNEQTLASYQKSMTELSLLVQMTLNSLPAEKQDVMGQFINSLGRQISAECSSLLEVEMLDRNPVLKTLFESLKDVFSDGTSGDTL